MTVERRPLGRTGIDVSLLGLGTVKLGRTRDVRYSKPFELPDDAAVARLFACARGHGVNLIDTAPAYGDSERRLGALLPAPRSDWVICTKVGEEFDARGSRFDFTPEHALASVRRSLERLRTDVLDIVLIHSDGDDLMHLRRGGVLDALSEMKKRGDIRAVGISHKTLEGGLRAVSLCDVVMTTYNVSDSSQRAVLAQAAKAGCGVLVKKPLASGFAADPAAELRALAIAPGVSSIVVGTIDPHHLDANARALAVGRVSSS